MDNIDSRQVISDWLATPLLALVRGNRDLIILSLNRCIGNGGGFTIKLRLIEQADLIRLQLLTAGRITTRQRKIQLFSERENLGFVTLVLCSEVFVAGNKLIELSCLISKQRLQCINVIGQLMRCNWHAPHYTGTLISRLHKTLE